ncbi:aminotransferase-like domain-containing protein [Thalassotalea fusca]
MTIWTPTLDSGTAKYLALANAIEAAIETGTLKPDEKLPPQRRLADALKVTVGTVTRAYSEAERRDLVVAKVGSGTFVKAANKTDSTAYTMAHSVPGKIDMRAAFAPQGPQARMLSNAMSLMATDQRLLQDLLCYAPELGHKKHRESFQRWLANEPVELDTCDFLITHGGQHAISVLINMLCREGDCILTENMVFPGVLSAAQDRGVKVVPIEMDENGIIPESVIIACQRHKPRAIYLTPNVQNPSGTQLSVERRKQLIDICRQFDMKIIEDDVQFLAREDKPISMQQLAPDICFYLTSFSKRFGGAIRIGLLVTPEEFFNKTRLSLRASSWTNSPLLIHWLSLWIDNGELANLENWLASEMRKRHKIAKEYLSTWLKPTPDSSFNLWLQLPPGWLSHEFVSQAFEQGVLVRSADEYRVAYYMPAPAVRLCLSRPIDHEQLTEAVKVLRAILEGGPLIKDALI